MWSSAAGMVMCAAALAASACGRFMTDIATRIRLAISVGADAARRESADHVVEMRPNGWPEGCADGEGYRVTITPGDPRETVSPALIDVYCDGGHRYYTGSDVPVSAPLEVHKAATAPLRATLRRSGEDVFILRLE